ERVVRERIAGVLASGRPEFIDFYQGATHDAVRLAIVMPIRAALPGTLAPGALVWRLDPASSIYPVLQWPVESATAELRLVRREQDGTILLSPQRGAPLPPVGLRASPSDTWLEPLGAR